MTLQSTEVEAEVEQVTGAAGLRVRKKKKVQRQALR